MADKKNTNGTTGQTPSEAPADVAAAEGKGATTNVAAQKEEAKGKAQRAEAESGVKPAAAKTATEAPAAATATAEAPAAAEPAAAAKVEDVDTIIENFKKDLPKADMKSGDWDKHEQGLRKLLNDRGITSMTQQEVDNLHSAYVTAITDSKNPIEAMESTLANGSKEVKEAAETTGKKAGFFVKNFTKPTITNITENWKGSSTGMKFGRAAGTGLGVVLAGHGLTRTFSKDEEGTSHPVSGLIETGAGAAAIVASLALKNKGAALRV